MKKRTDLQEAMHSELADKTIFKMAQEYAFQYLEEAFDRNVYPTEQALTDLQHFEEDFPTETGKGTEVIDFLNKYGAPATMAQIGGRYFGFVNGSAVPAGIAAKQLATFWDQNSAMQIISPIAAKLETVVEKWLKQIFNLPEKAVAGFVSGTSSANFCGLAAARYRLLKRQGWDINEQGLFGAPRIRIVAGTHAHSSILKVVGLLGFGKNNIEWVASDEHGRMVPELLPELDDHTLLILQAGNVNSGSFDPFEELCEKANEANAWVHIDGAFGLWAAAANDLKHLTKGIEKANSLAVDGHKTLNTPYDCGIMICSDKEAIVSAMHMEGAYLMLSESRDGMFYTPEMSRRSRIIELWATMKYLGSKGIDQMILEMHLRALQFADELRHSAGFTVLNEVVFNQVIIRCETDELTDKTIERIQELRTCWVGASKWEGRSVIRISVCSWVTTAADVSLSVKSFQKALKESSRISL